VEAGTMQETGPSKSEDLGTLPWYLFVAGIAALLAVPFLTWFNYGPYSTLFPSQVSLLWLFERGYWIDLLLYLLGVAAALSVTGMVRRPFAFLGVLPAAFPVFILAATLSTFFDGSMSYAQAVTVGVFTALFGSALLELSYFAYRRRTVIENPQHQSITPEVHQVDGWSIIPSPRQVSSSWPRPDSAP
jgi:hypothetical protein